MKLEKKIIATSAVFGVLVLVICLGIIYPTAQRIRKTAADTAQIRSFLEKRSERAVNMRASLKKITDIRSSSLRYPNRLFRSDQALDLITSLENIASERAVIQHVASSDFENPSDHLVHIRLTVTGELANVLNYLHDIENLDYFVNPDHVAFSPVPERLTANGQAGIVNMNLDLSLYVD